MKTIPMPSFGADMAEGTLIEWQVKPGDRLSRGQVVAVIETVITSYSIHYTKLYDISSLSMS